MTTRAWPTPAEVRVWEPWPTESVVIHNFWSETWHGRPIIFHRRYDPGTACRPNDVHPNCGHALPLEIAEKIAQPCRRCFPSAALRGDEA